MTFLKTLTPALLAATLCATATPARAGFAGGVGTYVQDRVNDFADIFRFRAGIPNSGRSIGLKARATVFAQAGYVYFDGDYWGMDRRSIGMVEELRQEGGVSILYGSNTEMVPIIGNVFMRGDSEWSKIYERTLVRYYAAWDDGRHRPFSLGLEIALPVVAFDAGLYPTEAFDFVIGFTTIDLYKDDRLYQPTLRQEAPARVPPRPDEEAPFRDLRERFSELKEEFELMDIQAELDEAEAFSSTGIHHESGAQLDRDRAAETIGTEGGITREAADELMEELDAQPQPEPEPEPAPEPEAETEAADESTTRSAEAAARARERQEEALRRQQERLAQEEAERAAQEEAEQQAEETADQQEAEPADE